VTRKDFSYNIQSLEHLAGQVSTRMCGNLRLVVDAKAQIRSRCLVRDRLLLSSCLISHHGPEKLEVLARFKF